MTEKPKKLYVVTREQAEDRPLMCGVCEARFAKHQMDAYDRHVYKCAQSERAHQMEQHSPRVKFPFFRPDFGDVEYGEWVKQHARAIAEKRMKM